MKSFQVQFLRKKIELILSASMIMNVWLLAQYQCSLYGIISCHTLAN